MSEVNRREFVALSGLAAGGAALAGCAAPGGSGGSSGGGSGHADQVVTNATIYTVDDDNPQAEALAVKSGRFLAVGSNSDIANLVGPGTERIDARRRHRRSPDSSTRTTTPPRRACATSRRWT